MPLWLWWHRARGHAVTTHRVSVSMWDIGAKGLLHECSCGVGWAQ